MSPAERRYWLLAQRRASRLEPEIAAAVLRAFAIVRDSLTDAELARIIDAGDVERLIATVFTESVLDRAFLPVRERIRNGLQQTFKYAVSDLPKAGKIDGTLAVMFDHLSPKVIEGIRALDSKVIQTLKDDTREVVRAFTENGLRNGVGPRTIARAIRSVVGLAPNQLQAVENFRAALEAGDVSKALGYKLRDKRFDKTVAKGPLTAEQIDRMATAYTKRMTAFHAETVARTASLDAMKQGQALAWQDAIDKGIVNGDALTKTWKGVLDDRERDSHVAMEGETVPFFSPYSNNQMIPGDTEWNCRCLSFFRQSA